MAVNNLTRGIACLIGAFLLHFTFGTIYTFGNMSPYISSTLRARTSNTWVTNGHMVWVFSITVLFIGTFMPLGGLLEKKIGARITCLIGSWIMSLGIISTYFTIKINIWCVMLTYGILFGAGSGLGYSVAYSIAMRWFPKLKGAIAGTVAAGYGLGSFVFNPIQTRYINPTNVSPNSTSSVEKYFDDPSVLDNIPMCFVIIGSAYAVIQLVGSMLLFDPNGRNSFGEKDRQSDREKEDVPEINIYLTRCESPVTDEEKNETNLTKDVKVGRIVFKDFTLKEAMKNRKLWIIIITFFFNGISIVTIASLYKSFGQTVISNDRYFSVVGAVASIFNSAGRPTWGRLLDIISYRKIMTALTICMGTIMGSFFFCSIIESDLGTQIMYFLWVCLLYFCLAGNFAMFPTITSQCFGNTNMATIFGIVFIGYSVSGVFGALSCSILLQIIGYGGVFIIATCCSIISLVLTQVFPRKLNKDKPNNEKELK